MKNLMKSYKKRMFITILFLLYAHVRVSTITFGFIFNLTTKKTHLSLNIFVYTQKQAKMANNITYYFV